MGGSTTTAERPQLPAHIEAFGDEIRNYKASLKAEGLSNKQMKAHPKLSGMVAQLDQMKSQAGIDPKTNLPFNVAVPKVEKAPKAQPASRGLPSELQGMGHQLRDLKSSLKARGLNNNQIKQNPQVANLTRTLNESMAARVPQKSKPAPSVGAWAASLFTGTSTTRQPPTLSPEAQAYKQQLQGVKKDLKMQGIKGPQLVQHPQVRQMQSQLDQMIAGRSVGRPQIPSQVSFVGSNARQQAMIAATSGRAPPQTYAPQTASFGSFATSPGMTMQQRPYAGSALPTVTSFSGYGGAPMPHSVSFRR